MKASNFTQIELKEYFNQWKVYFINYNKLFTLKLSQNAWLYFDENVYMRNTKKTLPYTKRGRFYAFTLESIKKQDYINGIENLI